jgi:hypothetical protein
MKSILFIFYPFLNSVNIPGTNPTAAAIGSPDAATGTCLGTLLFTQTPKYLILTFDPYFGVCFPTIYEQMLISRISN